MKLPIDLEYLPMELQAADAIPSGAEWQYEPKWDGFRALAFRDGDEIELQSKSGQPLARYFPEVVHQLRQLKAKRFVIDGEIMLTIDGKPSFDALLQRIHPAQSRILTLSRETPAQYLVFDLLVDDRGNDRTREPLEQRRALLESFAEAYFTGDVTLSGATRDRAVVQDWYEHVGVALDGVIAKRLDLPYQSGTRLGGFKIKRLRTADCVVGGYRLNKTKDGVGSLLLGLYDSDGLLNHVGFTSGFKANERGPLLEKVKALQAKPGFTGTAPGGPSRWKSSEEPWYPLAPTLVVEVQYDHVTANRFRHGTRIIKWRPDKSPEQCTMDQLRR
jgi:ATP-dependent DNA ligase